MGRCDLIHGEALAAMREMAADSVDAIVTDPPYFKVKSEAWDRQWDTPVGFLAWIDTLCREWRRILRSNGSLYVFASPRMAARVDVAISQHFNVLNHLVWSKSGTGTPKGDGRHKQACKESLRAYFPNTERIIFAEHYGADNAAKGEAGYVAACDDLRGFVFEPLRAYLDGERLRACVDFEQVRQIVGCAPGSGLPSHWFTRSQWMLPTRINYEKLRDGFNASGGDYLRREYDDLRREYDDLRREYDDLRRPFTVTADVPYTDVWDFPTVAHYPGKHPCEKPVALMEHIVRASTRPDAIVLDCFMGTGSTGIACQRLGRTFIGIDMEQRYVDAARFRLARDATPLPLFRDEAVS